MSIPQDRGRRLLAAYDRSLEKQLLDRGSALPCGDDDLRRLVEVLLREEDAREAHCLGLDPLRAMEETLQAEVSAKGRRAGGGRVRPRAGLRGLAKAFEVLEQAALNLHLGPWREEYRVVKMYSGMFTHYIKPVLSAPQIDRLFGLLGYQRCSSPREHLRLQARALKGASFLYHACAFFLARCECLLLVTALENRGGEALWELSVVRERQSGHSLQVALDNTKKSLNAQQPLTEPLDGGTDMDLYTDEQVTEGRGEAVAHDVNASRSLVWETANTSFPPTKSHSNGATSFSREQVCVSTLSCQLTNAESAGMRPGRGPADAPRVCDVQEDGKHGSEAFHDCPCFQTPDLFLKQCVECNAIHHVACVSLQRCSMDGHRLVVVDDAKEALYGAPALSSLSLCDDPKAVIPRRHPISYHCCCDINHLDPGLVCLTCAVFHSDACSRSELCRTEHASKELGLCSCGRRCSRKPLVLCRYCGNEYCNDCWYRNPVVCICGQTFDQSSSV